MSEQTDVEVAARLRLAIARIYRQLRQDNTEGLTLTQLSTLARVEENEPVRPGQLATLEGISPSTLTRLIASLEELGLIERTTDPADGRVSHLQLTDHGRGALDQIRSRRTALLQSRLSQLGPDARASLLAAIPALEQLGGD
ncbi:MarR family transcriptional regulator [Acidothermaceae bacterium B102]|nr:MarR family transcriptional regulator [Acidothermaceae bacterium B102]